MYQFPCECGQYISVEIFHAGLGMNCPRCNQVVSVPNSAKLRELSGDKYPFLTPIEKVKKALENGEIPFEGTCHRCGTRRAELQIPVEIGLLESRHSTKSGRYGFSLSKGLTQSPDKLEEVWSELNFPLLVCDPCHEICERSTRSISFREKALKATFVVFLLFLVVSTILENYFVAIPCGTISLLVLIFWLCSPEKGDFQRNAILSCIIDIPWIYDVISSSLEYQIHAGSAIAYRYREQHFEN